MSGAEQIFLPSQRDSRTNDLVRPISCLSSSANIRDQQTTPESFSSDRRDLDILTLNLVLLFLPVSLPLFLTARGGSLRLGQHCIYFERECSKILRSTARCRLTGPFHSWQRETDVKPPSNRQHEGESKLLLAGRRRRRTRN